MSLGTQMEKNSASSPPSRIRGMSMLPFLFLTPMLKVLSETSRWVVSSCESTTIARSWSCFACADTASAGGGWVRTTAGSTRTADATRTRMTFLMRGILRLFPPEPRGCQDAEEGGKPEEDEHRYDGAAQADAAPGHRIEAIHGPAHRHDERDLLQPRGEDERRHPGAAQHHHHQHRERGHSPRGRGRVA